MDIKEQIKQYLSGIVEKNKRILDSSSEEMKAIAEARIQTCMEAIGYIELLPTAPSGGSPASSIKDALERIRAAGYNPRWIPERKCITIYYEGNIITFFPKKGYFNGKGVRPGFGLDSLIEQIER